MTLFELTPEVTDGGAGTGAVRVAIDVDGQLVLAIDESATEVVRRARTATGS